MARGRFPRSAADRKAYREANAQRIARAMAAPQMFNPGDQVQVWNLGQWLTGTVENVTPSKQGGFVYHVRMTSGPYTNNVFRYAVDSLKAKV